jgi:hypothetical protein
MGGSIPVAVCVIGFRHRLGPRASRASVVEPGHGQASSLACRPRAWAEWDCPRGTARRCTVRRSVHSRRSARWGGGWLGRPRPRSRTWRRGKPGAACPERMVAASRPAGSSSGGGQSTTPGMPHCRCRPLAASRSVWAAGKSASYVSPGVPGPSEKRRRNYYTFAPGPPVRGLSGSVIGLGGAT